MKKGFTMVELLVVATIITLLATLGITTYSSLGRQSRDAKRRGDLENVRSALEQYRTDNNYYPGNFLTLVPTKYILVTPSDPRPGTQTYVYCPTPDGSGNMVGYDMCAAMESGGSTTTCCNPSGNACGVGASLQCTYKLTPLGAQ